MQTVQSVLDVVSKADNISTIIIGVLVVVFLIGKLGWDFWQFKKTNGARRNQQNLSTSEEEINSIEIITDTYIEIIKKLRSEVDRLKVDVDSLRALKAENEKLQVEINKLVTKNEELLEANVRQEKKIKALTSKVNKLEKSSIKKRR